MLVIYDISHNKVSPLVNYSDYHIERAKGQLDLLYFTVSVDAPEYPFLQREGYIGTEKYGEYVIKEININDSDPVTADIVADLNVETIKGRRVNSFEANTQTAEASANLALAGTGWAVGTSNITKKRTVKKTNVTAWEILVEIQATFMCELEFDTDTKRVNIYEKRGKDRGVYFSEQLNLKQLDVQGSTRNYVTCLIPIGKDGLTISSVNSGRDYISNYQYSNKNLYAFWEDNRYTVVENLRDDAIEKLDYLSKPIISYSAKVIDLANASTENYDILEYDLGDTITLLAESKEVKEIQRIVSLDIYPDEPELNSCEIANRVASLDDLDVRFVGIADTVDDITTQDGMVDGSKVEILPNASLGTVNIQNLNVVMATIGELLATKLTVTDLDAVNAKIDNLDAKKANIEDLNAINVIIGTVQAQVAAIDTALINKAEISDLNAVKATVNDLDADVANIETALIDKADIADLQVINAVIQNIDADVANIESILSGNIGTGSLQTITINSVNALIANATIKSAMIESINTDEVTISSSSGNLKIADNTIQISDGSQVRVQIGKDASDDYNLYVWDADGNLMFDASGIKEDAIKEAIIRDSMVADDAAIDASKVYVNLDVEDGSLDVLFADATEAIGSLNTSMHLINGLMSLVISEQEAEDAEEGITLYSKYSSLFISLDEISTTISEQETVFNNEIESMRTRFSSIEQNVDAVTMSFASVDAYINGTDELVGLSAYIQASINGLEIGASNSRVYSRFDNDSLEFLIRGSESEPAMSLEVNSDGESVVKTRNAEIIEELKLGSFVFTPRSNGNLSLKKV